MDDFLIRITEHDRKLVLSQDFTTLGRQYDNKAQRLVFTRPERYLSDDLVLRFFDGVTYFAPVNIGTENEFLITNALTQRHFLSLQIQFERDGDVIKHSNRAQFTLTISMQEGSAPIEPWPDPVKDLTENAFASAAYDGLNLAFLNLAGEEVSSVEIAGGGSGGTTNHAALSNLGYAQSGHTGFASIADVNAKADVSALSAHESNSVVHTTHADKDAIATIPSKLEASNIKAGSNVTLAVSGNDVTISAAGGGTGTSDHALLINRDTDDQHPISAITNLAAELGGKVEKVDGKGLSTNDLTDTLKAQYDGYVGQISAVNSKADANAAAIEELSDNIGAKANVSDVYNKTESDERFASISDMSAATARIVTLESTVGTLNETLEARLDGEV